MRGKTPQFSPLNRAVNPPTDDHIVFTNLATAISITNPKTQLPKPSITSIGQLVNYVNERDNIFDRRMRKNAMP